MKAQIKKWFFGLLGKDPEAIVVNFCPDNGPLARAMCEEVRRLEPERRHFQVGPSESHGALRKRFRRYRIGLAPVLFAGNDRAVLRTALLLAPTKILAYNERLERHHLKLSSPVASWLFLKGVPLDRIFLRPRWLCPWRHDKTIRPAAHRVIDGRPGNSKRKAVSVMTPYSPYPLSHGGAVRMFHLLRETAREFDVHVYAFAEGEIAKEDLAPVLEFAARVYLVAKPRYREPRWSTLAPPEVGEFFSPAMTALWRTREAGIAQIEYTYLASYGGDILVEHDVTYDLYAQVRARRPSFGAWWDWWRWFRYESHVIRHFRRVVVMSEKDRELLSAEHARVIENGVDVARFEPRPESPGRRLLFIGSFRHFPNIVAFRFLTEEILPLVPDVHLTVVAGPDPWLHWSNHTGTLRPTENVGHRILEFVADVRPLYDAANVVVVPTLESAGTNVKVLEAMAMERAVVSTSSGCAGLGLEHPVSVWIADTARDFAAGILRLFEDDALRSRIARAGRAYACSRFDWRAIGLRQRALLRELSGDPIRIRPATTDDLSAIASIQTASPEGSHWEPASYLRYECQVAITRERAVGFLVWRPTAPDEHEILNVAVEPSARRQGVARRLIEAALLSSRGVWFLEVRESNRAAVKLYETLGFHPSGRRPGYYQNPPDAAIVMSFFS